MIKGPLSQALSLRFDTDHDGKLSFIEFASASEARLPPGLQHWTTRVDTGPEACHYDPRNGGPAAKQNSEAVSA